MGGRSGETYLPDLREVEVGADPYLEDPGELRAVVELAGSYNVPVWLEGGVGALHHIAEGIKLGVSGTLLGSWQFHDVNSPPVVLQKCRKLITSMFGRTAAAEKVPQVHYPASVFRA